MNKSMDKYEQLYYKGASEKKLQKQENKMKELTANSLLNARLNQKQKETLNNMDYDTMKKEKKAVATAVTFDVAASLASAGVSAALGVPVRAVVTTDIRKLKTQIRVSSEDYDEIMKTSITDAAKLIDDFSSIRK